MVVWRGKGWIVMLLALLAVGIPLELSGIYVGLGQLGLFFLLAALIWKLGSRWNAGQNEFSESSGKFHWKDLFEVGAHDSQRQTIFGPETSPSHSLCMIKVQYWAFVYLLAGLFCFFISLSDA